jgi:hypothetical protein
MAKISCDYFCEANYSRGGCSLKATWEFEEAPYGTAKRQREMVQLCTRHFNADQRGELAWSIIQTSEPRRIDKK